MDKELFRGFFNLLLGIRDALVIIIEYSGTVLRDYLKVFGGYRVRPDLCGDTGRDISYNGSDGICYRGVLRNDGLGVEHVRHGF